MCINAAHNFRDLLITRMFLSILRPLSCLPSYRSPQIRWMRGEQFRCQSHIWFGHNLHKERAKANPYARLPTIAPSLSGSPHLHHRESYRSFQRPLTSSFSTKASSFSTVPSVSISFHSSGIFLPARRPPRNSLEMASIETSRCTM